MNNREIKFRVWSPKDNKFVLEPRLYVSLLNAEPMVCNMAGFGAIIQFYIGKKDNQGREIYEGDIVKFDIKGYTHGPEKLENNIGEVWYDEDEVQWCLGKWWIEPMLHEKEGWWNSYSFLDNIDCKTIEVIGNVFENGELIKK